MITVLPSVSLSRRATRRERIDSGSATNGSSWISPQYSSVAGISGIFGNLISVGSVSKTSRRVWIIEAADAAIELALEVASESAPDKDRDLIAS
ncbi:MAG: hypothetical protein BWX44_01759 [Spirochaetes bacterium ADurb.Bin001]|nr:MAG: hypothetical protein BWX44_01759 [Spirochaetes bacterium ADurb.Bin001]